MLFTFIVATLLNLGPNNFYLDTLAPRGLVLFLICLRSLSSVLGVSIGQLVMQAWKLRV